MNRRGRGQMIVVMGLLALILTLAACGPTATVKAGSGPLGGPTSDPLPPALKAYPTPTNTPVPAAPDCALSQLVARFYMGGAGTGIMFATILIWNVSANACSMEGAQTFYGVNTSGKHVTQPDMSQPYTLTRLVLPPRTPTPPYGVEPAPNIYLQILVIGAYRDDNTGTSPDGMCTPANEVTPARFVIVIGSVVLRVANYSQQPGFAGSHSIEGCSGAIGGGDASFEY